MERVEHNITVGNNVMNESGIEDFLIVYVLIREVLYWKGFYI